MLAIAPSTVAEWLIFFFQSAIFPVFMFFLGWFANSIKEAKKEKKALVKEIGEKYICLISSNGLSDSRPEDRIYALQKAGALRLKTQADLEQVGRFIAAHGYHNPTEEYKYDNIISILHLLGWASAKQLDLRDPKEIYHAIVNMVTR